MADVQLARGQEWPVRMSQQRAGKKDHIQLSVLNKGVGVRGAGRIGADLRWDGEDGDGDNGTGGIGRGDHL